ncbi:unnamed protein product [Allacma fusca]|uniref:SET domain-containing protein n=1 Tax=Allacma fusca TaxID=39272 RepID=A0A8J2K9C6_9HEXA|nr:unnamed protein product [Allacma fusca]
MWPMAPTTVSAIQAAIAPATPPMSALSYKLSIPTKKCAVHEVLADPQFKMGIDSPKRDFPLSPKNTTREKKRRGQHVSKLGDFFPQNRRSQRKINQALAEKQQKILVQAIVDGKDEGIKETKFKEKGRGVVACKKFLRGEFVVEYSGNLITLAEAKENEAKYAQDINIGCYMYYFRFKNRQYCIDATAESRRLGRLANHSRHGNCITKVVEAQGIPRLILVAKRDIEIGEEILYDYGDRRKNAIRHHPWLIH